MQNFEYCVPTKVVFGRDTESRCGELVRECGGTHALVVYGGGSAVRSGLLDRCTDSLKAAGIAYELLGGVQPNPRLSRVRDGIALAKETGADFLLAIGGGSVIDTAKAIGYALANPEFDIWELFMSRATAKACAPVGAVLTISAAGSETSNSCVITNEDGWLKKGVNYECSRPRFAIMNPALTCTLPPYQTASGGVDIMMHTFERYFSNTEHTELLDRMSEGLLKTVMANIKKALADPNDYDARAELMWAGSLSHNNLMGVGKVQDWATHKIEHELGGMFDVAHGAGLAAVWGSWARYVMHVNLPRFTRFAVEVLGCEMNYENPEETALAGIAAFESFCRSIGMPSNLRELGLGDITEAQMHEMAVKCTQNDTIKIGGLIRLYAADIEKIYAAAK